MNTLRIVTTLTTNQLEVPAEWIGKKVEIVFSEVENTEKNNSQTIDNKRIKKRDRSLSGSIDLGGKLDGIHLRDFAYDD